MDIQSVLDAFAVPQEVPLIAPSLLQLRDELPESQWRGVKWFMLTDADTVREDDAVGLETGDNGELVAVHIAVINVLEAYGLESADSIVNRFVALQADHFGLKQRDVCRFGPRCNKGAACTFYHKGGNANPYRACSVRLAKPPVTFVSDKGKSVRAIIARIPTAATESDPTRIAESASLRLDVVPSCTKIFDAHFASVIRGVSTTTSMECRAANQLLTFVCAAAGVQRDVLLNEAAQTAVFLNSATAFTEAHGSRDYEPHWEAEINDDVSVIFPVRAMFASRRFVTDTLLSLFNVAALHRMKESDGVKLVGFVAKNDDGNVTLLSRFGDLPSYRCLPNTPLLKEMLERRILTVLKVVSPTTTTSRVRFTSPLRDISALHNQLLLAASFPTQNSVLFTRVARQLREGSQSKAAMWDEMQRRGVAKEALFAQCISRNPPRIGVVLDDGQALALSSHDVQKYRGKRSDDATVFQIGKIPQQ